MGNRDSTAGPGGDLARGIAGMAQAIGALQREVEQLKRAVAGPGGDILWVVEGGTVSARRTSTGNQQIVAGPL